MDTMPSQSQITQVTQAICKQAFNTDTLKITFLEKVLPDDWGRNRIWRYHVIGSSHMPETVIVKISKLGKGHIYHEWASLEFLNQFPALRGLVPQFYGGEQSLELLVMEDIGDARNQDALGLILEGDDADLARLALIEHARQMGQLHHITASQEAQYNQLRSQFPETERLIEKDQFETHFQWFQEMLPRFGIDASSGLADELTQIIEQLQRPDAIRAYTRGDVCPSNVAYHNGQMRFYDFEMGAYRNIFLSAVYFRLSHVSCLNGSVIPRAIQEEAEQVYFEALSDLIPEPKAFQADYAGSAIAMLIWILSRNLEKKNRPRHLMTRHQRVWAGLTLYLDNPTFSDPYPHITNTLQQLRDVLSEQYSDETKSMPVFPAFVKQRSTNGVPY